MEIPTYTITIDVNAVGFNDADVDKLRADEADGELLRNSFKYIHELAPTCEGPDSYRIFVEVGVVAALIGKEFLQELTKDLYRWTKRKAQQVFNQRRNGDGFTVIKFADKSLMISAHPSSDEFAEAFLEVPSAVEKLKNQDHRHWSLCRSADGTWKLEPEQSLWD